MRKAVGAYLDWCLPLLFGCHRRPDRSFHFRGRQFPICARCTGELIGLLAGLTGLWRHPPVFFLIVLLFPMIVDGVAQLLLPYQSTNMRRLLTGMLFGYAVVCLLIVAAKEAYQFGFQLGSAWL